MSERTTQLRAPRCKALSPAMGEPIDCLQRITYCFVPAKVSSTRGRLALRSYCTADDEWVVARVPAARDVGVAASKSARAMTGTSESTISNSGRS
jgi:hypothetical protein